MADTDRRVRRTRAQLRDALVRLILERGWDAVSVSDVCERADVGRSTFYLHFADKEDLLLSGFAEVHAGLRSAPVRAKGPFGFVAPLFEHARENAQLMRALIGRKSGQAMQRRFRDLALELVDAELDMLGSGARRAEVARFLAGALTELLLGWLEAPRGASADAIAQLFAQLATGALRAAR